MNSVLSTLWQTYETINEWIRFADTKAAAVLGINGILVGFAVTNLSSLMISVLSNEWLLVVALMTGLSTLVSVYFAIKCLNPTLKIGEPTSLIYYAHIASQFTSPKDYYQKATESFSDDIESTRQIANQVWVNSIVSWKKYQAVTRSIWFLIFSLFLSVLGLIVSML